MKERQTSPAPALALAGSGLLLALVVAVLLLVGLTTPAPGLAAPQLAAPERAALETSPNSAPTAIYTAFLPINLCFRPPEPVEPNVWRAEYYATADLSGAIVAVEEGIPTVDFDWGTGNPVPGVGDDMFSIRWTGEWDLELGEYTFFFFVDDDLRFWYDDVLLLDTTGKGAGSYQATVDVAAAGLHRLRVEYAEYTGSAVIRMHWRRTDLYPQWFGEYYGDPWVEYNVWHTRSDSVIQFDWGLGAPFNLPADGFSVSWQAERLFPPGTHRIWLYADEGFQLNIAGIIDDHGGWYNPDDPGGSEDMGYVLEVPDFAFYPMTFNFHDRGTLAEARLWIENMEYPTWYIEFFENTELSGTPVIEDPDGWKIFFDWGFDKPRKGMAHSDYFSIRWSGPRFFNTGCYRFGVWADDGARVWVNGELMIDAWTTGPGESHSPVVCLENGYHDVIVEYWENTGEAEIRFWWE